MARKNFGIGLPAILKKDEEIKPFVGKNEGKLFGVDGVQKPITNNVVANKPIDTIKPPSNQTAAQAPITEQIKQEQPAMALGLPAIKAADQVQEVAEVAAPAVTADSVREQIKQARLAQNKLNFEEQTRLAETGAQEAIKDVEESEFEQRRKARTQDVTSREGIRKSLATQGLSGSGSRIQSNLTQNVVTGQRLGASEARESDVKGQIQSQLSQTKRALQLGMAGANAEMEIAEMESELRSIETAETQMLKNAELQDQRDYDLYLSELGNFNDTQRLLLETELENKQAEIEQEYKIAISQQNSVEALRLEGARAANSQKLEATRAANNEALQTQKGAQSLAEIEAKRTEDQLIDTPKYSDSAVNSAVSDAVNLAREAFDAQQKQNVGIGILKPGSEAEFSHEDGRQAIIQFLAANLDEFGLEQGTTIMFENGIDPAEVAAANQGGQ